MNFVNNWTTQLTAALAASETTVPIPAGALGLLPDGEYMLTLSSSQSPADAASVEIVAVRVMFGGASMVRAQEGTTASDWPAGTFLYCAVTAGTLNQLSALIGSGGAIRSPINMAFDFVVSLANQSTTWSLLVGAPQPFTINFPSPPEGAQAWRLEILILNFGPDDSNCSLASESAPIRNVAGGVLVASASSITRYDMLALGGAWFVVNRTVFAATVATGDNDQGQV
ncbi:hypothetical protein ABQX22_18205 [Xanthomonas sp. WHRI 1810A]|uniref:hypothetical protein n=1 Tax=Xanthomonas sp. WHRI 1810A TaxID=3161565 RepID=UPI0032E880A6